MRQSGADHLLARELTEKGLRATRQRVALLRLLRGARNHPTVVELHHLLRAEQRRVSRKTVYEILDSFITSGLATRPTEGGEPSRYEPKSAPHDHARCRACGRLFDLPLAAPRRRLGASVPRGFHVEGVSVLLRGVCRDCRRAMPRDG